MDGYSRVPGARQIEPLSDADVLRRVRDARFSTGLRCVRCGSPRVQRWGTFSDRQRYRCRDCRRTFSDLTATPAAYSKKLTSWPLYARCFELALTVRASARVVKLHPCTAFRWRHALAGFLRDADRERLGGHAELSTLWFAVSRKGERGLPNPRRRAVYNRFMYDGPQSWVFLACDRAGHVVTDLRRSRSPDEWDQVLAGRLEGRPIFTAVEGFDGRPSLFAERIGASFHDARYGRDPDSRTLAHIRTVSAYIRRFRAWLARFRGVATKYLPNYLVWHRRFDATFRHGLAELALRWPLAAPSRAPP